MMFSVEPRRSRSATGDRSRDPVARDDDRAQFVALIRALDAVGVPEELTLAERSGEDTWQLGAGDSATNGSAIHGEGSGRALGARLQDFCQEQSERNISIH
jgi:hypothetical protein